MVLVCNVFVDTFANLYFSKSLDSAEKEQLSDTYNELTRSGRYDCLLNLDELDGIIVEFESDWKGDCRREHEECLRAYLASISNSDRAQSAWRFVGSLGIVLVYEMNFLAETVRELDISWHRYLTRMSQINADLRAAIVAEFARDVEIASQKFEIPETERIRSLELELARYTKNVNDKFLEERAYLENALETVIDRIVRLWEDVLPFELDREAEKLADANQTTEAAEIDVEVRRSIENAYVAWGSHDLSHHEMIERILR
jgi:hypothetical protein